MTTTVRGRVRSERRRSVQSEEVDGIKGGRFARTQSRSRARQRLIRAGQSALGLVWLLDGALQFQSYMFGKTFVTGVLLPNASGQPAFIASTITWIAHAIEPHVTVFNAFAATVQVLIGLGLLYRKTVGPALLLSFAWAGGIWLTGEGLGGFFNDTANPLTGAPGAVLLYVLVGLMVWPKGLGLVPERLVPARVGRLLTVRGGEFGLLGVRGARVAFAALWGMFGLLWLLPANDSANAVSSAISSAPTGTGWLTSITNEAASLASGNGTAIAVVLAAASFTIAVSVLRDWHVRECLALSAVIALAFWILQGFGGLFTGEATDVNTGPLLVLLAWLTYGAMKARAGERGIGRPGPSDSLRD
jgi:hypothetical protein